LKVPSKCPLVLPIEVFLRKGEILGSEKCMKHGGKNLSRDFTAYDSN
jgi:hypothetical protein